MKQATIKPMTFEEMIGVVKTRAARTPDVLVDVQSVAGQHPRLRICRTGTERWAEIELDYEVFFLDVDRGYRLVDSALTATEQVALLRDLTDAALAYLTASFEISTTRSRLTGRKTNRLILHVGSVDRVFRKI